MNTQLVTNARDTSSIKRYTDTPSSSAPFMQLALLFVVLVIVVALLRHLGKGADPDLRAKLRSLSFYGVLAVLALLVLTGRMAWFIALVGGLIAGISRLMPLLIQFAPLLARLLGGSIPRPQESAQHPRRSSTSMTREDALNILGLEPNASREAIVEAHRRLIQKLHPDRGGSDYLASQINQARKVLIGE